MPHIGVLKGCDSWDLPQLLPLETWETWETSFSIFCGDDRYYVWIESSVPKRDERTSNKELKGFHSLVRVQKAPKLPGDFIAHLQLQWVC